jgi:nitroreductase
MGGVTRPSGAALAADAAMASAAQHLAQHLADAPVLIVATVRLADIASTTPPGACIYPALQNLMLAARSLGLGTTLTTLHRYHEKEVKELLGIPDGVETMALIPLGWPQGRFGPVRRRPPEEVAFWDRWDATRSRPRA